MSFKSLVKTNFKHLLLLLFYILTAVISGNNVSAAPACQGVFLAKPPLSQDRLHTILTDLKIELQKLKSEVASKGLRPAMNEYIKKDIRKTIFAAEGILRLYIKNPKVEEYFSKKEIKTIESALMVIKELEDATGKLSLALELFISAQKFQNTDPKFIEFLDRQVDRAALEFNQFLITGKWSNKSDNPLDHLNHSLEAVLFTHKKEDRDYIHKSFSKEVKRAIEKIDEDLEPLIQAKTYGFKELEHGFHEWRRLIRWFPIFMTSLPQHFILSTVPKRISQKNQEIVDKYGNTEFVRVNGDPEYALELNALSVYQISYLIKEIGRIKSEGETIYYLTEQLSEFGYWQGKRITKNEANNIVRVLVEQSANRSAIEATSSLSIEERAHQLFKEYEQMQPLERLIKN